MITFDSLKINEKLYKVIIIVSKYIATAECIVHSNPLNVMILAEEILISLFTFRGLKKVSVLIIIIILNEFQSHIGWLIFDKIVNNNQ